MAGLVLASELPGRRREACRRRPRSRSRRLADGDDAGAPGRGRRGARARADDARARSRRARSRRVCATAASRPPRAATSLAAARARRLERAPRGGARAGRRDADRGRGARPTALRRRRRGRARARALRCCAPTCLASDRSPLSPSRSCAARDPRADQPPPARPGRGAAGARRDRPRWRSVEALRAPGRGAARRAAAVAAWGWAHGAPAGDRVRAGAAAGARRHPRAGRLHAGPGGDRRRGDRQGTGAAGRRPGGALGRALDARRLRPPVRRRAAPGRLARTRAPRQGASTSTAPRPRRSRRRARNGVEPRRLAVEFPDRASFAPLRVRAEISAELDAGAQRRTAERPRRGRGGAARAPRPAAGGGPAVATGGGYSGPLAYRQGEGDAPRRRGGLRPDGGRRGAPTGSR